MVTKFTLTSLKVAVAIAHGLRTNVVRTGMVATVGQKIGKKNLTFGQDA